MLTIEIICCDICNIHIFLQWHSLNIKGQLNYVEDGLQIVDNLLADGLLFFIVFGKHVKGATKRIDDLEGGADILIFAAAHLNAFCVLGKIKDHFKWRLAERKNYYKKRWIRLQRKEQTGK